MSMYPYRTYVPTWPTGYQREHAEAVYVGPPLREQGPMSAEQLPPELDHLVSRDLGPAPLDQAAIASIRRMAGRLDEPRGGRRSAHRRPGSLSARVLDLLREVAEPMTSEEIARTLGASVGATRSVVPKLAHKGDLQVRHIQARMMSGDFWARRSAQYLAPGIAWPPVPDGYRLYVRGAS